MFFDFGRCKKFKSSRRICTNNKHIKIITDSCFLSFGTFVSGWKKTFMCNLAAATILSKLTSKVPRFLSRSDTWNKEESSTGCRNTITDEIHLTFYRFVLIHNAYISSLLRSVPIWNLIRFFVSASILCSQPASPFSILEHCWCFFVPLFSMKWKITSFSDLNFCLAPLYTGNTCVWCCRGKKSTRNVGWNL